MSLVVIVQRCRRQLQFDQRGAPDHSHESRVFPQSPVHSDVFSFFFISFILRTYGERRWDVRSPQIGCGWSVMELVRFGSHTGVD